jgi:hypothetical protein
MSTQLNSATRTLWIGNEPDPDDRLQIDVDEADERKVPPRGKPADGEETEVLDHRTGRRLVIRRASCGLDCYCALELVRWVDAKATNDTDTSADGERVIQTCCEHCGQDVEGFSPFPKGEWRDRGNNTNCPDDSGRVHAVSEKEIARHLDDGDTDTGAAAEWSGSPDPVDPDNYWIDDKTGERVNAKTGERAAGAHTAMPILPLRIMRYQDVRSDLPYVIADQDDLVVATAISAEFAAFIVRAVNAHAALVKALLGIATAGESEGEWDAATMGNVARAALARSDSEGEGR